MHLQFRSRITLVICVLILAVALLYRSINLATPFWVDEFSSAHQAQLYQKFGLGVFFAPEFVEHHNVTTYSLIALSFSLFGKSEWAARLPSVIVGSLVPVALYLLGKKIFTPTVGLIASVLTVFSYIEITWSRQARGYMLQQLFLIVLIYAIWMWIHEHKAAMKSKWLLLSLGTAFLGVITHTMFVLPLLAIGVWMSTVYLRDAEKLLVRPTVWIVTTMILGVLILLGVWKQLLETIQTGLVGFSPHIGFYHAFLWREYGVIIVLASLGALLGWGKYRRAFELFLSCIVGILFFVCFIFQSVDTRYLLLFFPWMLFLFTGVAIERIALIVSEYPLRRAMILLGLPLLLIVNGHKFVLKPKPFYSVNHDFREIALIDYDALYTYILGHGGMDTQLAIVETWPDRLLWYMPSIGDRGVIFRWKSAGPLRNTNTYLDEKNIRRETSSHLRFIGSLPDLLSLQEKYPKGFIWIDDTTLPRDVVDYVEKNMKKELYLDHYTLDDNPYSIWPGTLYSWGMKNQTFALKPL